MKRLLTMVALALSATGCGSHEGRFGDLKVVGSQGVVLRHAAPPASSGPARSIRDVEFVSPSVGVLAARHVLQRTTDGGDTWRDTANASVDWLAAADARHFFGGGSGGDSGPVLLVSSDGGRRWQTLHPRLPRGVRASDWRALSVTFVTRRFGVAVPDPAYWGFGRVLRTRDGGRTWQRLRLRAAQFDFIDAHHGFAIGYSSERCPGALWRTDDGGDRWSRVTSLPCGVPLFSIDFVDARHGFVAGGWASVTEQIPSTIVYATNDGGRTWRQRFVDRRRGFRGGTTPFVQLRFADPLRGSAATGACKCCPSGPCAGELYITRDGGWTWRDTKQDEVQLSTIGLRHAWSLPSCDIDCNALWRTRDGGYSWRPLTNAANTSVWQVGRTAASLLVQTDVAGFASRDGRGWRLFTQPETRWSRFIEVDARGGSFGLRPPAYDTRCNLEAARTLSVSLDAGNTWTRRRPPFSVESLAGDAGLAAAVGVRRDCTQVFALSRDLGATWEARRLPRRGCTVSLSGEAVWLGCGRVLLTSRDRGRTWTRHDGDLPFEATQVAATPSGAWAVFGVRGSRLWRTTDAGRTWVEQWPRLPTP